MKHRHPFTRNRIAERRAAFSLLELAIVITVTSTVAVLGLEVAGKFIARRAYTTTEKQLEYVDEALTKFKKVYGRLPCPSPLNSGTGTSDGLEGTACSAGTDDVVAGLVPYRALNLQKSRALDGDGNRINYSVSRLLAVDSTSYNSNAAAIEVRQGKLEEPCTTSCSVHSDPDTGEGAAYFLFSSGKDARAAVSSSGAMLSNCYPNGGTSFRIDVQNCTHRAGAMATATGIPLNVYYSATFNNGTQDANYFDDIVTWKRKDAL